MDDFPEPHVPRLWWREGSFRRVLLGSATGMLGGSIYAMARSLPPTSVLRGGMTCGIIAAPFFTVREMILSKMHVDGPVASAVAGGFIGYFGALALSGPNLKVISSSTMVMGVSCGLVDVIISSMDWQRKVYFVQRRERQERNDYERENVHNLNKQDEKQEEEEEANENEERDENKENNQRKPKWWKWSDYVSPLKDVDQEYRDLLRSQQATVIALKEEQARIALLLQALESVKAGNVVTDIQLQHANSQTLSLHDQDDEKKHISRDKNG